MWFKNYEAWEVDPQDFDKQETQGDKLKFLIRFGVLAPSSHNTQPWHFQVCNNEILLSAELERALPESDRNNRQLFTSLGCALENILIAADYYDLQTSVQYLPQGTEATLAAKITFGGSSFNKAEEKKDHLMTYIQKRTTNRNKYSASMPPEEWLEKIKKASVFDQDTRIDFVQEQAKRNNIADTVMKASIKAMGDHGFRKELSKYVKSNITKSKVGMPAFGMGIPTPISLLAPTMIRYINMGKLNKKSDEELLKKHTPLFAIISTREDAKENWIKAGQAYQRVALEAERAGLKTAVMAAAIQIDEFYKELQGAFDTPFRPQVFFRMGYTKKESRHSPRLLASDTTSNSC